MAKRVALLRTTRRELAGDRRAEPLDRAMSPWESHVLDEANKEIAADLVLRDEDLDDYLDGLALENPDDPPAVTLKPLRR